MVYEMVWKIRYHPSTWFSCPQFASICLRTSPNVSFPNADRNRKSRQPPQLSMLCIICILHCAPLYLMSCTETLMVYICKLGNRWLGRQDEKHEWVLGQRLRISGANTLAIGMGAGRWSCVQGADRRFGLKWILCVRVKSEFKFTQVCPNQFMYEPQTRLESESRLSAKEQKRQLWGGWLAQQATALCPQTFSWGP